MVRFTLLLVNQSIKSIPSSPTSVLEDRVVTICHCFASGSLFQQQLVRSGFFPTAPSEPRVAIAIEVLDFYFKLHERSGDAIMAVALALRDFYESRGMRAVESDV